MKLGRLAALLKPLQMPPTRGHDLKHARTPMILILVPDAPHTGARLETSREW